MPSGLRGLVALRVLSLDYNELPDLPPWLPAHLPALTCLDVSGNALASLPAGLGALRSSLQTLHAASNQLSAEGAAPALAALPHLTDLDLSDNTGLGPQGPAALWGLSSLVFLSLAGTGLQQLPERVSGLQRLRWLDAADNCLAALPLPALTALPRLTVLKAGGNAGLREGAGELQAALRAALPQLEVGGWVRCSEVWVLGAHSYCCGWGWNCTGFTLGSQMSLNQ